MSQAQRNDAETTLIDEVADLDELVRELNNPPAAAGDQGLSGAASERNSVPMDGVEVKSALGPAALTSSEPATPRVAALDRQRFRLSPGLGSLLQAVVRRQGSDLHLVHGAPPFVRVDGDLEPLQPEPLSRAALSEWLERPLTNEQRRLLETSGAVDFSVRLEPTEADGSTARFRVNVHRQRGTLAASLRALPRAVPEFDELGLPATLRELVKPLQGVVLVCGPTGAGKSTTLAALVDWINRDRRAHILTLEDPVEYEHRNRRSLIQQMEVGIDIPDFAHGLRAALRQDPDVILLGEMRDLDSIATALAAAETGHLLLSTVHTSDPAQAIHRVVDVFPADAREQIRQLLAAGLEAIVCQRLVPRIGGGRVLAVEILRATTPVRHHIRSGGLHKLYNEMVTGQRHGMVTMESALAGLVERGLVTREDAMARSTRPDEVASLLRHLS